MARMALLGAVHTLGTRLVQVLINRAHALSVDVDVTWVGAYAFVVDKSGIAVTAAAPQNVAGSAVRASNTFPVDDH